MRAVNLIEIILTTTANMIPIPESMMMFACVGLCQKSGAKTEARATAIPAEPTNWQRRAFQPVNQPKDGLASRDAQ